MSLSFHPLSPKILGGPLRVIAVGRVSSTTQNIENIAASHRVTEEYLRRVYSGEMDIVQLGECASGMLADRATIREAEELIATGTVDVVIAEDLSRIYRNPRLQFSFVQDAVDMGTRVICVGDGIDTADENWEIALGAAALRHGLAIPDIRRRVRRTADHTFAKGGMVLRVPFGYRKLSAQEARSGEFGPVGLRIAPRSECGAIIRDVANRVLQGNPYQAIVDSLNAEGVRPGPYVTTNRWSVPILIGLLENPVLSGTRMFRKVSHERVYRTGKHRRVRNASPETQEVPQLAHLPKELHLRLLAEIGRRRAVYAHQQRGERRRGVPRKRTYWPGQGIHCGVCGEVFYLFGNHLKCSGAKGKRAVGCWNHLQISVRAAREKVLTEVARVVFERRALREHFDAAFERLRSDDLHRRRRSDAAVDERIAALVKQASHLATAIATGGSLDALVLRLRDVEGELATARKEKAARVAVESSDQAARGKSSLCSAGDFAARWVDLASRSYDAGDWLRKTFTRFTVCPVQALDAPHLLPRGKLTLDADGGFMLEIDLFERAAHIRLLDACLALRQAHPDWRPKRMAREFATSHQTVRRALAYALRVAEAGWTESYREVTERPRSVSRWR